jgi:hypothetical protein
VTRASWRWSLLLVAAVYLLTLPGTWGVTDQAEMLYNARRLLDRGTLRLSDPGVARVAELPWLKGDPGTGLRSRFLPLTMLTLVPLVALDAAIGAGEPLRHGALAHLQGVLLTLVALGLLGWSVRRLGASPPATAAAVLFTGLCWPVWRAGLRGGAEPVMLLLVTVYLAGVASERGVPSRARRGWWLRALACLLLPWANPEGTILAGAIVAAAALEWIATREGTAGSTWGPPLIGCLIGNLGVMGLWNHGFHGDLWRGGYGAYNVIRFAEMPLARGLGLYVGGALAQVAPLMLAASLAAFRARRTRLLVLPVALAVTVIAVFATHYLPEPTRRLAPVWPAWAFVVAVAWDDARGRPVWPWLLVIGQALLGFQGFMQDHGRYYQAPDGLFYPWVLWVRLALAGRPWWQTALPVAVLLALIAWSASRVRALAAMTASGERAAA